MEFPIINGIIISIDLMSQNDFNKDGSRLYLILHLCRVFTQDQKRKKTRTTSSILKLIEKRKMVMLLLIEEKLPIKNPNVIIITINIIFIGNISMKCILGRAFLVMTA